VEGEEDGAIGVDVANEMVKRNIEGNGSVGWKYYLVGEWWMIIGRWWKTLLGMGRAKAGELHQGRRETFFLLISWLFEINVTFLIHAQTHMFNAI
jgi:hypothetical protein